MKLLFSENNGRKPAACTNLGASLQPTEKLAVLQQAITVGLDSRDAGALDMQAIKHQARAKAGLKAG